MAINLGDNIKIQANLPIDYRYFNNLVPYTSTGQVLSVIPVGERYIGLTVNVNNVEYWFRDDINTLVLKINAGTLTGATNGLHLTAGGTQVALGGVLTGDTEFSGGILKYQTSPVFTDGTQIIDKNYADAIASGVHPKLAVQVATTGQTTLSGLTTVDGIALTNGDRVLVKNQTNEAENGIYIATGGTWQWSDDFNYTPSGETVQGTIIPVITGATNKNTLWVLVSPDPILSGSSKVFTLYSTVTLTAGNGIIISGSTIIVDGANLAGTYLDWDGTKFNVDAAGITSGYVTQSSIDSYTGATQPILDAAITGATNGLSKTGRNVCLGGTLTSDVIINNAGYGFDISGGTSEFILEPAGITLAFSGQSVNFDSNAGLEYSGDYSANYTDRSLVDKEYVDNRTSGSTVYNCASPSTILVGGMNPGTALTGRGLDDILQEILAPYLAPAFSSFSNSIPTTVEVGCQISGSIPFTWSFSNSGNVSGGTMCICDVTASGMLETNSSTTSHSVAITTRTFTGATPQYGCGCTQLWRGVAKSTVGASLSSSNYQVTSLLPYFWGKCNCPGISGANRPIPDSAMVNSGTKVLASSSVPISITFNATSGNDYIWFAIPSQVLDKNCWCIPALSVGGQIGGAVSAGGNLFPSVDTDGANNISVTTVCWSGVPYDVYISNKQTTTLTNSMTLTRV